MTLLLKLLNFLQVNPYRRKVIIITFVWLFLSYFFPDKIKEISELIKSYLGFTLFSPFVDVLCFKLILGLFILFFYLNLFEKVKGKYYKYLAKAPSPFIVSLRQQLLETKILNISLFFMCGSPLLIPLSGLELYPLTTPQQMSLNICLILLYYYQIYSIPFYEYEKIEASFKKKLVVKSAWSELPIGFLILRFKLNQALLNPKFDQALTQANKIVNYLSKSAPSSYQPVKTLVKVPIEGPSNSTINNLVEVLKSPVAAGIITAGGAMYASHMLNISNEKIAEIEERSKANIAEIEERSRVNVALIQERKAKLELECERLKLIREGYEINQEGYSLAKKEGNRSCRIL